ncbi:MAG: GntR family transcriptional regulator [Bacteroidetes bacterium]|nr:MAG: GntR family transcriptional regulator [Bacteroidota bacterium]
MIATGRYNTLEIDRETTVGLFLVDDEGNDVLLPRKYYPETFEIGDKLEVFIYRDSEDRQIATNLKPYIDLHKFAFLQVKSVGAMGAFLDWGMEKDLLVPFAEQQGRMEDGKWYVVYLELDDVTDRLFASAKVEKYLENEYLRVAAGDEVDLLVYSQSPLGYSVIVNQVHQGLIFNNEVFGDLAIGSELKGWVKQVRNDQKLDITLNRLGYENSNEPNAQHILAKLQQANGFLPYGDKSDPQVIYTQFGMSKKAFKKAIGSLYKNREIEIEEEGIRLRSEE